MYFVHFPLFYLSLFLILVIVISLLIKEEIRKVTSITSIGLGLILIVPIFDWVVGGGYLITYPLRLKPYLINFLNPFISITNIGVSPGQRIVIVLICFLIATYSYLKRRNLLISSFAFLISWLIIIFWGGLPTLLAANRPENIYLTGGILNLDEQKFAALFALLFLFFLFIYYYLLNREHFKILVSSLRPERMLFYGGAGIFGLFLAMHQKGFALKISGFEMLGIVSLFLSLALGFQGAQIINDFFDIEADQISRKRNPLLRGINRNYYTVWGFGLILLALCLALIINYSSFLIMTGYLLLSVIYSVPPIRLKRVPLISTFILAVAVIMGMVMGFTPTFGNQAFIAFPKILLIPTLIGITLGFIAKDIKDVNGDRKNGVLTLPVLLYKDTLLGRLPIAILIGISYLFYVIFIPKVLLGAMICSLLTIIYTIFVGKIKEWFYFIMLYIFGFYLLSVMLGILR